MPLDQNKSFLSSSTESTATSMSSSSGLTINNQIIGGLHSYPLLSNIINADANNKIPLVFQPASSSTSLVPTAGCNPSNTAGSVCLATEAAIALPPFSHLEVGDEIVGACGAASNDQLNTFCEYLKEVTVTTPASLVLNPDLHSSGRLQLGMVVYIQEKNQSYQFVIDNYKDLYDAAEADIVTSEFNSNVRDSSAASQSLIDAWTVHKVEGELKNPADEDSGRWSRDEANWKKYPNVPEYFTINAVPASEEVDGFNFEDAYIVVPQEWDGKKVVSVEASLFTMNSSSFTSDVDVQLLQTSKDALETSYSYKHTFGEKSHSSIFAPVFTLSGNSTLQLKTNDTFGSGNRGYTATFKVIS
jgi:hypothetical protein